MRNGKVVMGFWFSGLFIALSLLTSVRSEAEEVTLCGSTTVQKNVMEPAQKDLESATGLKIHLLGTGTGKGMEALVKRECDAAMASEQLADAIASMKKAGGMEAPPDLQSHQLGRDRVRVIVNLKNQVTKLTKEQLKGLHTGKIENWKDVGGLDSPVVVITSHAGSATRLVFQKIVMDGENYVNDAIQVKTTREEIEQVRIYPEGIGAVSEGFLALAEFKDTVKVVDAPDISRPLLLVTKGDPSPNIRKILDFFKGDGRKYVQQ